MFPLELLRVRTIKGQIKPVYADLTSENLDLATRLLWLFQNHVGKRKGDLFEKVTAYETVGFNYKLVRGLSLILERLSSFQV